MVSSNKNTQIEFKIRLAEKDVPSKIVYDEKASNFFFVHDTIESEGFRDSNGFEKAFHTFIANVIAKYDIDSSTIDFKAIEASCKSEWEKLSKHVRQKNQSSGAPTILEHLSMIESPELAGKPVTVEAVISSNSTAYLCPAEIEISYGNSETSRTVEIDASDPINIELFKVSTPAKHKRLKEHFFLSENAVIRETRLRNIYSIRLRPKVSSLQTVDEKVVDEKGFEYKGYDVHIVSDTRLQLEPSKIVRLEGLILPEPRTQKTTLLAYKTMFQENDAYDLEKVRALQNLFQNMSLSERLNWILNEFEKFSGIVGRRNLALAGLLAYFTPLHVKLDGETQRGWGNIIFCGDTTTGKTQTVKKLILLLKAGTFITAETASTVGLTGTAIQAKQGEWFIDWGFLPLNDRRLLAIDGVQKLTRENWATLAEAERNGIVTIVKAAKSSARARTRQIKIGNPVNRKGHDYSTKRLQDFTLPCQALSTILDETSIARLDLAVFSQNNVAPEEINRLHDRSYNPILENLSEVLKWCWSGQTETVFSKEAVDCIHDKATILYKKYFYEKIPLVSIDVKWKLARLSAALAYLTLSTEDYKTVKVSREHVEAIADFISQEYDNVGLNILARKQEEGALSCEDVKKMFDTLEKKLEYRVDKKTLKDVLEYIVENGNVTRNEIRTQFDLSEYNQLRPLLSALKEEKLVRSGGKGIRPTRKLVQVHKILQENFLNTFDKDIKVNEADRESSHSKKDNVDSSFSNLDSLDSLGGKDVAGNVEQDVSRANLGQESKKVFEDGDKNVKESGSNLVKDSIAAFFEQFNGKISDEKMRKFIGLWDVSLDDVRKYAFQGEDGTWLPKKSFLDSVRGQEVNT
ncbi:MAG: hypothetical protein QXE05_06245 [Nitrososphaeria archaeon]